MTDHVPEAAAPAPPAAPAHPGFLDRVGAALHHGEAEVKHAAAAIEGDTAALRVYYLEHAAAAHELAALALRTLQDADPAEAAVLEQIVVKVLPVAETAARIAGAVLAAL